MKRILILLLTVTAAVSYAQPNHNVLQIDNAPYYELSGDKTVNMTFATGDEVEVKELYGETFNLYGKSWLMDTVNRGVLIFPNAFIEVVEPNNFVICDGMLRWLDSIDNTSKISYKIDGVSGTKVLKVQWKNLRLRTGQPGNYVNMQIWLYQKDGIIEYRYGPSSASNASGYTPATGPSIGISYSDFNFSSFTEKIWIHGTPPNILIDSARNANFPNIWGVPSNGTVYRFIPRSSVSVRPLINGKPVFNVYPSPAYDVLYIVTKEDITEEASVKITDVNGRIVKALTIKPGDKTLTVQTAQLSPGNYNITIAGRDVQQSYVVTISH